MFHITNNFLLFFSLDYNIYFLTGFCGSIFFSRFVQFHLSLGEIQITGKLNLVVRCS